LLEYHQIEKPARVSGKRKQPGGEEHGITNKYYAVM